MTVVNEMCNYTLIFDDYTTEYLNYYYFTLEITTNVLEAYIGRIDYETAIWEPKAEPYFGENNLT